MLYSTVLFISYFIYCGVYMSGPVSQFILPTPVPMVTMFIFYIRNSVAVFKIGSIVLFFSFPF